MGRFLESAAIFFMEVIAYVDTISPAMRHCVSWKEVKASIDHCA